MPTRNFASEFEPKSWNDVYFQDNIVKRMRKWVRESTYPSFIFASGTSGSGKTSSIRLMIKATHCINRQPGEDEPCGVCPICKGDPVESSEVNNVIWVQATAEESAEDNKRITYQAKIKDALMKIQRGPVPTGAPHRDILFVVFDECQLMPNDLRQQAMAYADVLNPLNGDVVLIFMTMSPEKIPPMVYTALTQRGFHLKFATPSVGQIQQFLIDKFRGLDEESAWMIAKLSRNSLRGALTHYGECYDLDSYVTPEVVRDVLRISSPGQRLKLWQMLERKAPFSDVRKYIESLCSHVDPADLMKQLSDDLLDSLGYGSAEDHLVAGRLFLEYFVNPSEYNAFYTLLELSGRKLVDPKIFTKNDREPQAWQGLSMPRQSQPGSVVEGRFAHRTFNVSHNG